MNIREAIESAKCYVEDDPHLANYILRDYQEVKEAGLDDLAWAFHQGYPHRNDVRYFIDRLEQYLSKKEAVENA